jgi:hypothetical protein
MVAGLYAFGFANYGLYYSGHPERINLGAGSYTVTGETMLFIKSFGIWLVLLLAAFINGAMREMLIAPRVGEQIGHRIGVVVFSCVIFGITYVFVKTLTPVPFSSLLYVGLFWLALSLLFECGFFHYVMHEPWEKLLADYNIFRGRLLIVVWLTTLFSPLLCGWLLSNRQ